VTMFTVSLYDDAEVTKWDARRPSVNT